MRSHWTLKEITKWVYPDVSPQALHKWIKADAFLPHVYVRSTTGPGRGYRLTLSDTVVVGILRALFALGFGTKDCKDLGELPGAGLWLDEMTELEKWEVNRQGKRKLQRYLELLNYDATLHYETTSIAGPSAGGYWESQNSKVQELAMGFIVFPRKSIRAKECIESRGAPTYSRIDVSKWRDYVVLMLKSAELTD